MKRIYLAALAASLAVAAAAPVAWAGIETGPKVALHVSATTSKASTICNTWTPNTQSIACSSYNTQGALNLDQLVYLVVAQADTPLFGDGVGGVNLGLEYDGDQGQGLDVTTWTICADGLEVPNGGPRGDWPESGGGNVITWLTCQQTRIGSEAFHAVLGALSVYAYGDDKLRLTPNRNQQGGSVFALSTCAAAEIPGLDSTVVFGWAGFGSIVGCNPCTAPAEGCPVPVEPATWGKIKTLFGR